jgi:vacuolar-type H+-ATPase subunit H
LLESFKAVLEKEREAEKLILKAEEQAEKIKNNAQEKGETVYMEMYRETIDEAKRKSIEMKDQAKTDAESEAQIFIKNAEKQKKKLLAIAELKFGEAVNSILTEILS